MVVTAQESFTLSRHRYFFKMRLILVRHGETEANITKIIQGHTQGELNQKGLEQAGKVAERLKGEHFDVIISSDLKRAKQTAEAINKFHSMEIIFSKQVRERHCGVYENGPSSKYLDDRDKSGVSPTEFRPEGGESHADLRERVKKFFNSIFPQYKGKTVLIVSHGGFLNQLVGLLLNKDVAWSREFWHDNTGITIIDVKDGGNHEARLVNCTKHLENLIKSPQFWRS
jgi:broad specificity phosphatase PhoE